MDPLAVTTAKAASTGTTASTTTSTAANGTGAASKPSFRTLFAEAEKQLKSGEKLTRVAGHPYARISGGARNGECINLSGNARTGEAFDLVVRNGRTFHAYGSGAHRVIVGVPASKQSATTAAPTNTGGTRAA